MIHWINMLAFVPLTIELGYENPWDPCCTTPMKWEGYCTSSRPWTSPSLLWTPCTPPTHSSWYPCSPWRVGMVRWSRSWISYSQFLNRFLSNGYVIHSFFNMQVIFEDIMFELRHVHILQIRLDVWAPCTRFRLHYLYNDTEHYGSMILGVEILYRPDIP